MTKTTINTAQLTAELEWVSRFANPKPIAVPILANVLLATDSATGMMKLSATDLETGGITYVYNEGVHVDWKYTVPARLLLKYLKKIDETYISLHVENDELIVEHGESKVSFAGMSAESFPELPAIGVTAEVGNLRKAIRRTMVAVSKQESRFTLNGALLDTEAKALVSTDGHRLSYMPVAISGEIQRTVIPTQALVEAEKLLGKNADSLFVGRDENHIALTRGDRTVLAHVLAGNFPDYQRILPKEFDHTVLLDSGRLSKTVNRLRILAPDNGLLSVHVNGSLELSAENLGTSKGLARVPIVPADSGLDWGTGSGFNGAYLEDFAKTADGEISFHFSDPTRGEKEEKDGSKTETLGWQAAEWRTPDGWRYVVMPMRA